MSMDLGEQRFRFRRIMLSRDYDLPRLAQAEIERNQHLRHGTREMGKRWAKRVDRFLRTFLKLFVVAKLGQSQKIQRSD